MKIVSKIIETHGGLEWLRQPGNYIGLENPPYMRLVIEYIGEGPRGLPAISVAHYYEQNGDAMRDPETVFEIDEIGTWHPVFYLQDNLGLYQEAVILDGEVRINPKLVNDLSSFARQWDKKVDALMDKLTHRPDGTRRKLVGVDRLLEFLDTFKKKDVADDEQLRTLVDEVRGLLQSQDVSQLRKDQSLRELVQERMQGVKVVLDTLVLDAPTRQIVLRD